MKVLSLPTPFRLTVGALLLPLACAITPLSASAVEDDWRAHRAEMAQHPKAKGSRGFVKMLRSLDLSETQKTEIKTTMESFKAQAKAIRDSRPSPEARPRPDNAGYIDWVSAKHAQKAELRGQIAVLRAEHEQKIFALLTPEQQDKWMEKRQQRFEKKMARRAMNDHE